MKFYTGKIIDSHMHLWDYYSGNYPWLNSDLPGADKMLGDYSRLKKNYLANDYLNDLCDVKIENSVHIQVFGFPENPALETKWLCQQKKKFGYPSSIIGFVDLVDNNAGEKIYSHLRYPGFIGIRNVLCYHNDPELRMISDENIFTNANWKNGFSKLIENDLIFETQIFDMQIPNLVELLKEYPSAKIMIDHLAWPTDFSKEGFLEWKKNIKLLSSFKNVYVKISALGCIFKKLDKNIIAPYLHELLSMIGPDRCCLGSNFPVDGLFFNFRELYYFYDEVFYSYSSSDKDKLFYRNAKDFYLI